MLQIYNERCIDLLSGDQSKDLPVKMNGHSSTIVEGLTEKPVESADKAQELLALGTSRRRVAFTKMNAESSRSHLVFTLRGK
jgi:hypothetical protein